MDQIRKKRTRLCALLLVVALLLPTLGGCGEKDLSGYETVAKLAESGYVMAFREGDQLAEYVQAAVSVLASQGVLRELSLRWLGEDLVIAEADKDALAAFDEIPEREFIFGFDPTLPPMVFSDGKGGYQGFDVELAERICALLHWELKYQPIDPNDLAAELLSGDVDGVWGGIYARETSSGVTLSTPYMEVDFLLITLASARLHSLRALKGKYLSMGADRLSESVLDENPKLRDGLASISKLASGSEGCFEELRNGACDVILVPSTAAIYYMSH